MQFLQITQLNKINGHFLFDTQIVSSNKVLIQFKPTKPNLFYETNYKYFY